MKFRLLATATMFAPLCLAASVRADSSQLKQLQAIQTCLSCNAIKAAQPLQLAQEDWKQFSSDKGKFVVLLPGKPTEKTQTDKTDDVTTEDHTFTVETEESGYIIGYSDFVEDITQIKPDELLDAACEGVAQDGDKLLSKRVISLGKIPGREVEYRSKEGVTANARIFLVGQRLYQLHAVNSQPGDVKKFFDSFKLKQ